MKPTFIQRLKSLSTKTILLITSATVVVIATIVALSGTIASASKRMEKKLYGEEIGNNHLRYKHGDHIYNPETGEILVDSIDWLHINYSDTIAILAKNNRRAFINLNTAQLITPLIYEKAWEFACDRGIMVKSDTIYIFRRDGSIVNPLGFKYKGQYDLLYHRDKLIVNVDNDKVGLIDTAAISYSSYCECFGDTAVSLCDNCTFEKLDSFSVTFLDSVVYSDSIPRTEFRNIVFHVFSTN